MTTSDARAAEIVVWIMALIIVYHLPFGHYPFGLPLMLPARE